MANDTTPTPGDNKAVPDAGDNQAAPKKKEFTDDELNVLIEDRLARDRKARDAELKDLKAKAKQWDEAEKAKLSEMDRLKADLAEKDKLLTAKDTELSGLKLERVKSAKLAAAGIDQELIVSVNGTTEEEVEASVAILAKHVPKKDVKGAQGAGNPGVTNTPANNSKKIWKESEIKELRLSGKMTDTLMEEIRTATLENRVQ